MMSKYIKMMERCRSEIISQRRTIESLSPKADAYETIRKMIGIMAPQGGGYDSEDLVYVLDKEIETEKIAASAVAEKVPTP